MSLITCQPYRSALWLLLVAGIALALPIQAQDPPRYVPRVWDTEDGLPIRRLLNAPLVQTQDGYLWIGTRVGLIRFDGIRFERFSVDNTAMIPDMRITNLFETRDGGLWIATWDGDLIRYRDRKFEAFLSANQDTPDPSYVTSFFEDPYGKLWISTHRGIMRLIGDRLEPLPIGDEAFLVESLLVDDDGIVWFSAGPRGVYRWQNGETTRFGIENGLSNDFSLGIYKSADGRIWVSHPQGMVSYVDESGGHVFSMPGSESDQLHFLNEDTRGRLWLSVGSDLYYFNRDDWEQMPFGEGLTDIFPQWFPLMRTVIGEDLDQPWFSWELAQLGEMVPDHMAAPPENQADTPSRQYQGNQILRDFEDNVWLAGFHEGLIRLKPALFEAVPDELFNTVSDGDEREEFNLLALGESRDGSVWFVGLLSALIQRLPDGTYHRYGTDPEFAFPSWSVLEDKTGTLWVSGAICHRDSRGKCERFESVRALRSRVIRASVEDAEGTLWFGTDDGLFRFIPTTVPTHPDHGEWTHFNQENGLPYNMIQTISPSRHGGLWLGTNGGGLIYADNGVFRQWQSDDGLASNKITSVYEDERGVVWVGSEDFGLTRIEFDSTAGSFPGKNAPGITEFRNEHGLFHNGINSIVEDDFERLWMGTRSGIFWISRESLDAFAEGVLNQVQSTAYTVADGLRDQEANSGTGHTAIKASDGRLWFATQFGAAIVDPAEVFPNSTPPPIVIESAQSQLEPVEIENESVVFDSRQRDFDIAFTGLSLSAPSLVRFRYRLEGYDDHWVEAGFDRTATYTQVPPGRYSFRVIAANNDGVWNEEGATLAVRVMPFFWETWWFRSLVLVALALVVVAADRSRLRRLVIRKQQLEQTVAQRTQQLRAEKELTESQAKRLLELDTLKSQSFENISHEFRQPLTMIIGPLQQMLAGKKGSLPENLIPAHEMMLRHSSRLLRLTNQILDLARVESGLFKPVLEHQDIIPLVREAVLVFTPLAERKRITLKLDGVISPDGSSLVCTLVFDREMMRKVIANLLSNALKFTGEDGSVRIDFRQQEDTLELDVTDNGPGIAEDGLNAIFNRFNRIEDANKIRHTGTGIGLSIVKEFTEAHGGSVQVRSEVGVGTTFTVRLPLLGNQAGVSPTFESRESTPGPAESISQDSWLDLEPDLLPITGESAEEKLDEDDRVTVLVVDDHQDIRSFIRSLLEDQYRVLEAEDGVEGLKIARDDLPDLIIADVMMPRMDGLEFNRELKRDRELSSVPIILLTARATPADHEAGLATEVDQYLTKPFDPDILVARIQSLLRIRHRLRDLMRQDASAGEPVGDPSSTEGPQPVALSAFARKGVEIIRQHLADPDFGVDELANEMIVSRWQLRRRLVEEAGMTPNALIRQTRLEEASKLLLTRAGNVSEVAYAVGFQSLSHFSRSFKNQFNMSPSEFPSGTS